MSVETLLKALYSAYNSGSFSFQHFQRGDKGDDTLTGTSGNDRLVGMAGNDTLNGLGGHDLLKGYVGDDTLNGGTGSDVLMGGHGADKSYGGDGNDVLLDYRGNDLMYGGDGDDFIYASFGANRMEGGKGNDTIIGGKKADLMYGDDGADIMSGGSGSDEVHGGAGNDKIQGYYGRDNLYGEAGNDTLMADGGRDTLRGGGGNDILNKYAQVTLTSALKAFDSNFDGHNFEIRSVVPGTPGIGRDRTGADSLFGGTGDDKIYVGKDDTATGGAGADTFAFVFTGMLGRTTAKVTDFDVTEDKLRIAYTDAIKSSSQSISDPLRVNFVDAGGGDLELQIARTGKEFRKMAIIEDGASLGLTAADVSFELMVL